MATATVCQRRTDHDIWAATPSGRHRHLGGLRGEPGAPPEDRQPLWENPRTMHGAVRDPQKLQELLDAVLLVQGDLDLDTVLLRVVEVARGMAGARFGALGVIDDQGTGLSRFVTSGVDRETIDAIGPLPRGSGLLGTLILDPKPLRLDDLASHPDSVGFPPHHPTMVSFLGVPLRVRDQVYGNLYLTEKEGAPAFSEADEDLVVALAGAVSVTIENARLHDRLREAGRAADRERIARDLHDTVIQQLFAIGLSLQAVIPLADDVIRGHLQSAIDDLDETIRQVRTTIFALEPAPVDRKGLRARVLEICVAATRSLGLEPEVRFSGGLDTAVDEATAGEVLATLREALSNVARHAAANNVTVELTVADGLQLRVVDDGVGLPPRDARAGLPPRDDGVGNGIRNMVERAQALGGSMELRAGPGGGAVLSWRVPLERGGEGTVGWPN